MNKRLSAIFKGDTVIWMVFFFLCIISIVEVYSASSELTFKSGSYIGPMVKHVGILMVGFFMMLVVLNIECKYFKLATFILLLISLATLVWVLIAGHLGGESVNGASRWMSVFGFQFQPSELAKGSLVLATAQILAGMQTVNGADKHAMKFILAAAAPFVVLIGLENLSTAALLCGVIYLMMIIGRVPTHQLVKLAVAVLLFIAFVVGTVMAVGDDKQAEAQNQTTTETVAGITKTTAPGRKGVLHRFDTWKARIMRFADAKDLKPEEVDLDKDAQTAFANIAIASSNVVGKGPGNSVERDFLPQAFSDYIYAIIIEELGLFGAFFVAFLYVILLFRTGRIVNRCERNFPAFLAMGLALLLVVQALFNMCVAVGLAPVTGQPLPLISKGGSSSIINCVYIGAILSVSRTSRKVQLAVEPKTGRDSVADSAGKVVDREKTNDKVEDKTEGEVDDNSAVAADTAEASAAPIALQTV